MDRAGVDISTVQRKVGVPTGASAVIVHGDTGENQICVGVGANKYVCADQFDKACLADTCILVLQVITIIINLDFFILGYPVFCVCVSWEIVSINVFD